MMRKNLVFTLLIAMSVIASAQTQHGYVKTKGRLNNNGSVVAGTRLPGATVKIKGGNAVVSGNKGTFSIAVASNTFYLQSVQKQGYVLIDPDVLRKQYVYSRNPLVLVLETPEQQTDDRLAKERQIRCTLQSQLQEKEDAIEALKEQQRINEDEYRRRLQDLYAQQENNEKLISQMADRYAKMDFDELDEFNRRISQLILDGNLTEADSLINTKGDLVSRVDALRQHQKANAQAEEELQKRQNKLDSSKAMTQKELEDIAQDCYNRFEIFKMRYENDSAAFCLELRASVDSTNVRWQKDAGDFLRGYVADYQKALSYYELALKEALLQGNGISYEVASLYASIGAVHAALGHYDNKNECFEEAKDVAEEIHYQLYRQMIDEIEKELNVKMGDFNLSHDTLEIINQKIAEKSFVYLADSYKQMATLYGRVGGFVGVEETMEYYEEAIDYYEDLLEVQEKFLGDAHPEVIETCINIGVMHSNLFEFDEALKYYERAQKIVNDLYGESHSWMVTIYNNMGYVYAEKGDCSKALDYFEKAKSILENESEANHWSLVRTYCNIGAMYCQLGRYSEAGFYYSKALKISKKVLGEKHPQVGVLFERIGSVYSEQGDYQKALECCYNGLMIFESVYGKSNPIMISSYKVISGIYVKQGDFDKALDYYQKILEIKERQESENEIFKAICYNDMGDIYYAKGDNANALDFYQKALMIIEEIYNEKESLVTRSDGEDGTPYFYIKSTEYMAFIFKQKRLEMVPNITTCYRDIGNVYCQKGDFDMALVYYQKALAIRQEILGGNHPDVLEIRKAIDEVKLKLLTK